MNYTLLDHQANFNREIKIQNETLAYDDINSIFERYPKNVAVILEKCSLIGDFTNYTFDNWHFNECQLDKVVFNECSFNDCSSYKTYWKHIQANNSKWQGCDHSFDTFSHCQMTFSSIDHSVYLSCLFDNSDLNNLKTNNMKFQSIDFIGSNLSLTKHQDIDFTCSTFSNCDLSKSFFAVCDFRGVNWELTDSKKRGMTISPDCVFALCS